MKCLLNLFALMSIGSAACAQTENLPIQTLELQGNAHLNYKYALKLYNTTVFSPEWRSATLPGVSQFMSEDKYLSPSPALQIATAKKNFHELELSSFSINKKTERTLLQQNGVQVTVSGTHVTTTDIALRYEYIHTLAKRNTRRLVPAVGFSAQPYFFNIHTQPYTTVQFPVTQTRVGIRGAVIPRITWYATNRLFFDANIPLTLIQGEMQSQNIKNPVLPVAQQKYSSTNFDAGLQGFSFRIGAGLKL